MRNALSIFLLFSSFTSAFAADVPTTQSLEKPLTERATTVQKLFRDKPSGYGKFFADSFRAAVPDEKLTSIFSNYFKSYGKCTDIRLSQRIDASTGIFEFTFDKGFTAPVTLAIDVREPHKITGLLIGAAAERVASFDDIIKKLKSLPGTTSLLAQQLDAKPDAKVLGAHNADKSLAIGSTFKLYILAQLVKEIEAGQRQWSDVIALDEAAKSLPSGQLQDWPEKSPLTLHTLASMMISRSDNTAADQLLRTLGRQNVEAIQKETGHAAPEKNVPFLSTLEMFKLKGVPNLAEKYLPLDASRRRSMLDQDLPKVSRQAVGGLTEPKYIDQLEWFATAQDLARLMNYLRQHTEKAPASAARAILAINPGLSPDKTHFPFVAYKGGSEAGVLNLTFLLKSKSNHWYALSATWNNPAAPLDDQQLLSLLQSSFNLLD
ncbi:MAG TPA: serine hydrolase [Tepidisphaeraceae bacterium]|jgi:beta-lactamase class A